ncbi:hydroxymyristoyl-ACP dehydratase [Mesobacillus campisalis]|jgi:hypothetical protein|uniref:Hydroxymyristoyl-ACP dehydratase n=1 Tax=Mesobacillus campisalis TaxID=1408103 RepID=A0A0M2T2H4_9BACI|nr:DNA-directed RNA polymerase subunit beta [Mesobacillus campisalis]KKK39020.1 hydroxymyristoyl-ACP dehydratase [Mesobacillus campisalis]
MALNSKQQESATREQVKTAKKQQPKVEKRQRIRVRLIPIWLRVILVIVLLALSIIAGAAFGYGVMGNGNPKEIFEKSTWTHILDLVEKRQ